MTLMGLAVPSKQKQCLLELGNYPKALLCDQIVIVPLFALPVRRPQLLRCPALAESSLHSPPQPRWSVKQGGFQQRWLYVILTSGTP